MRVLFVYPEFPDTYWSFKYALAFEGKCSAFPPLGLLTISAMFPAEWQRRLIDMSVEPLTDVDLDWAAIVFASAMLVQKQSLEDVVLKCVAHGKRVVVGGPFVFTTHDYLPADHIFIGEAESLLPEFLRDLRLGITQKVYRATDKPVLTSAPVPYFELLKMNNGIG